MLGWIAFGPALRAQFARVSGVVGDSSGRPLAGAVVTASQTETGARISATSDQRGEYSFISLAVGVYTIKAEAPGYQSRERQGIDLAVGGQKQIDVTLAPDVRPGEHSELNAILESVPPLPGLPADTIASSVSVVVDENKILQLPLASRNIYSLFLQQPGVTSQGAIVRRGLSFAVHGQRISGSNYLLDGVDNNNTILTGPVAAASAEAIREFRMVNSSFSAENGRATGFVAHVVTRAGGNRLQGSLFEYFSHDRLNANTFQNNSAGVEEPPMRQNQFGASLTGPLRRNQTFFSSVVDLSRLRYSTANELRLPSAVFIASLPPESTAARLLREIPPLPTTPTQADPNIGVTRPEIPNRIDTLLATERLDHVATEKDRLSLRYTLAFTTEQRSEEAEFTGYPDLRPTDHFRAQNAMLGWTHSFDAVRVNDFKLGWSRERIALPRPRSDVPVLARLPSTVFLPGNLRQRERQENNNVLQISDVFSIRWGRSLWTTGFEYRRNFSNRIPTGIENEALGGLGPVVNGLYQFADLRQFALDRPTIFAISVDRFSSGRLRLPDLRRKYRSGEYSAFVQDDIRLGRRLSLNAGLRYEDFGVPHNVDRSQDVNYYFGPGSTIQERLTTGTLRFTGENPGDLRGLFYRPDRWNFAPSVGIAWDPFGRGRTILRLGYALALDRVFDTVRDLTANNRQVVACLEPPCTTTFVFPAERMLPLLNQTLPVTTVMQLDESLRTPYAQNWYAGVQQSVTPSFLIELGHAGSVGRKLISRDTVNRSIGGTRLNPRVGEDTFISNAGNSNYLALEAALRRRFSGGLQYQISYTYSHAIDNQSDILEGARVGPRPDDVTVAAFTRQFDARVDRGNANFDQRHNLIFNAIWDIPAPRFAARWPLQPFARWTTSVIGGYRTGFPVTVIGSTSVTAAPGLRNNRVDFLGDPAQGARASAPITVAGGVQWLDRSLFRAAVDHVGNLGRGAVEGPGFWNYDFAVMRNMAPGEGRVRVQFRTEFYNLLNHANLSAPVTLLTSPDFGRAFYGRNRTFSRFGDLPLDNPARRIQFALRIHF